MLNYAVCSIAQITSYCILKAEMDPLNTEQFWDAGSPYIKIWIYFCNFVAQEISRKCAKSYILEKCH